MAAVKKISAPIRSISRAIAILTAINRQGIASLKDIAAVTDMPYPTVSRILQTLVHEGLIEKDPARKRYRPTALVKSLSQGFQDDSRLVDAARPHLLALTKKRLWPVSIVTRVGHMMVVRDTTHTQTSLTFYNVFPGHSLPILECASGRLYLAYADPDERQNILEGLRLTAADRRSPTLKLAQSGALFRDILKGGYCAMESRRPRTSRDRISTVAVPLFENGRIVGTLSLNFFASAMKIGRAVEDYLGDLKRTAKAIETSLGR